MPSQMNTSKSGLWGGKLPGATFKKYGKLKFENF